MDKNTLSTWTRSYIVIVDRSVDFESLGLPRTLLRAMMVPIEF